MRKLLLAGLMLLQGLSLGAGEIPPDLKPWKDWVQRDRLFLQCPSVSGAYSAEAGHLCVWPGRLVIAADARGAEFELPCFLFSSGWIEIPGSMEYPPGDVRVDGRPFPVVFRNRVPALHLRKGRHRITGRLRWDHRPESIRLPGLISLVDLRLDGRKIFPLQRSGDSLWLGRPERDLGESDALAVEVYRKLKDGVPAILETRIRLNVSGRGREQILGPVLPENFRAISLSSRLPVLLGADNRIRIQLRPGHQDLRITARAIRSLESVTPVWPGKFWPEKEIWVYEATPRLRVSDLVGAVPVDPSRVDLPQEWSHLPAFALSPEETLSIEERSRGMAGNGNSLQLSREIWLDFRDRGMTIRDRITGKMNSGFRLDLRKPFELLRAESHDQPLMVSVGEGNSTGVELRNPVVDLRASSRLLPASSKIPVTGWDCPFDSVETRINLPPGRILIAAPGADSCPEAWIGRWTLLDVFLVLITTMLAFRLLGRGWGAVTGVFLMAAYHESRALLFFLLLLILVAVLRRAFDAGRVARMLAGAEKIAMILLALAFLPFAAREARLAIYPQLELSSIETAGHSYGFQSGRGLLKVAAVPDMEEDRVEQIAAPSPQRKMFQRYLTSNVVQAGSGEPNWTWRRATLRFAGPVSTGQQLRLLILPAPLTRLIRLMLIVLAGLIGWKLFRAGGKESRLISAVGSSGLIVFLLCAGLSTPAQAGSIPPPELLRELQSELSKAPECLPDCGSVESAKLRLRGRKLEAELIYHAAARISAALPTAGRNWDIRRIEVDGRPVEGAVRRKGIDLLVPLARGVHRIILSGEVSTADSLEIRFPEPPGHVELAAPGWDVSGLRNHRLLTGSIGLSRSRAEEAKASLIWTGW